MEKSNFISFYPRKLLSCERQLFYLKSEKTCIHKRMKLRLCTKNWSSIDLTLIFFPLGLRTWRAACLLSAGSAGGALLLQDMGENFLP